MRHVQLSQELEAAFTSLGVDCVRGEFQEHPTQEIEHSLTWLCSEGIIAKEDLAFLCDSCNFGNDNLQGVIDTFGTERIDELLITIKNLRLKEGGK